MIEFTLSRVTLCVCGVVLIASVTGVLDGIYENDRDAMDGQLVDRFAYMLDVFQSSGSDSIVLDGGRILPEGCTVFVHDGFVELHDGNKKRVSTTSYQGEFQLNWRDTVTVTRRRSLRSS